MPAVPYDEVMVSTSNSSWITPHPKGTQARVLLSSVFGPYAQDDEFGSRSINPMELYHNQVTREQGSFSLRMFHRSWGLMMIQRNISAPSTLLDFPTLEDFQRELTSSDYDIVGISGIIPNFGKVREMCRQVRRLSPNSIIVVGGHVAAIPGLDKLIDADYIVRGEGISWMRRYLGEDPEAAIVHPEIVSGFGFRILGMRVPDNKCDTAATIIPSVGCPLGCNFCTTSSFFGGKGKSIHFYEGFPGREFVLHDGRKLPVESSPRHATPGAHEGSQQELGALCFLVGECHPQVHHGRTGATGCFVDLGGTRIAQLQLRQTEEFRYPSARGGATPARYQDPGFDDRGPRAPHAREHS